MLLRIRKHKKILSAFFLITFLMGSLNSAYALTSGPSQPETQQFAPAGMDNLVDPFTGDFSYNIPLMDVGGYPININYEAGIMPDAEASWVGLGWNLNVGAINRNVRGIPDDFSGEQVTTDYNVKPNETFGISGDIQVEIFGAKVPKIFKNPVSLSANLFYNTYNGFGMTEGADPSISASLPGKGQFTAGLGLSLGSEDGLGIDPTLGFSKQMGQDGDKGTLNTGVGFPFSSREGLKGMSLSASYSATTQAKYINKNTGDEEKTDMGQTAGRSGFIGFATPTFSPSLEHNTYNISGTLSFNYSNTDPVAEIPGFGFSGYYSGQFLKSTSRSTPAYGYMYSGMTNSENKMMDFNREKDAGAYNKYTTNLAVTNYTYDIYQVSGQGVGGTYRLYRGDVGSVHDPLTTNQGYSPGLGVEVGVGEPPSAHVGADLTFSFNQTYSAGWPDDNTYIKYFTPEIDTIVDNPNLEPVYFKKIGEMVPENDANFLNNIQLGYNTFRNTITTNGSDGSLDGSLTNTYDVLQQNTETSLFTYASPAPPINSGNMRQVRNPRTTSFTSLTVNEAKATAILPIQNYGVNDFSWNYKNQAISSPTMSNAQQGYSYQTIARDAIIQNNQLSELRVTDNSGSRYIYGIPVYNKEQQEISFALESNNDSNATSGLIVYNPGTDDSDNNNNGFDNYYNNIITPPYAHSYLLTCVLSADYVDSDSIKGPSDGDLGTYTKFNYTKVIDNYQWRTPYSATTGVASFSENMHGSNEDDRANYVYGVKEVWYLHSIETRTHVAEFYLKDRQDGLDAAGQSGGVGSNRLKYLDKVVLYSKPDKFNTNPEPIKTVHFEYDYSLCPGTPNSTAPNKGKLTLKKIWFTYGTSQKGILNPYVFCYADQNFDGAMDATLNPSYSINKYDRWGNYKGVNPLGLFNNAQLSNAEFPYTFQDSTSATQNAAVWALSSIQTPTGGTLRVYYESDDYAYVQDQPAMRMFQIVGSAKSIPTSTNGTFSNQLYDSQGNYDYMVVYLGGDGFKPVTSNQNQEFVNAYLSGIDLTYFKVLLNTINNQNRFDYVPGYAEIDPTHSQFIGTADANGYYHYAAVALQEVSAVQGGVQLYQTNVNPIVRTGWMFSRLNLSRQLYGSADATSNSLQQVLGAFVSELSAITQFVLGFVESMKIAGNSSQFDPNHSFIRLNDPHMKKFGGGHRVKAVVMVDNWGLMKSEKEINSGLTAKQTSAYGQIYNYTYQENGTTISAGVAAYEPIMGNEENPFRLPVFVTEKVPLAPSKEYYLEEPFGESFFPAPQVGYRQVVVTPLKITDINSFNINTTTGNGTGTVEHEFYTAYDFPAIANRTDLKSLRHKPSIISQFMKFDSQDLVTCTQGYYVEVNDMHGKPKAKRVYPEASTSGSNPVPASPISEIIYIYQTNADGTLNNQVSFINPDLSINNSITMGVDVDVVQDERYDKSTTLGGGLQLNLKYVQAAVFPIIVPTFFPDFSSEQTRFRSVVTTKVVNKYGILKSTTARDNGSVVTTQNLAWDAQTAEVLLTQVQNEFNDPIYNFTYPGHWAYSRMNFANLNEGAVFSEDGNLSALKDGDELYIQTTSGDTTGYYISDPVTGNSAIVYKDGTGMAPYTQAKIIRSGSRNMPTTPVGSVVTLDNPIKTGSTTLSFTRVINAGVNQFQDTWKKFCNCPNLVADTANPIVAGLRGNIRPLRSWSYLTERTQTLLNNNLNVRSDGYFKNFVPFWQYSASSQSILPASNLSSLRWQFVVQTLNYNPMGMEIENQDALLRYSMAQFGYGQNLPVATSNNSKYQETGFDGFEDYNYGNCYDDHFSWRSYGSQLTNVQAHTGRQSIQVPSGTNIKIKKIITPCGQ